MLLSHLDSCLLQMENSHILNSYSVFCFTYIVQPCPVFTVHSADPALKIELLISSQAPLFCSLLYPGSIAEMWIIFLGRDLVRDKCFILLWLGNSCDHTYSLVIDGLRFVLCHSAKIDTFTVLFLLLASARKIGIDYFCHLVFLGDKE